MPRPTASRALGELLDEAQWGSHRGSVAYAACVARLLAEDARAVPAGPAFFFSLDASSAEGGGGASSATAAGGSALECATLPLPLGGRYGAGRGWAFACWLQLSPRGGGGAAAPPSAGASPAGFQLARFVSVAPGGYDVVVRLAPTESPAVYTLSVRVQLPGGVGFRGSSKRTSSVSAAVRLPMLRWHHIALSQTAPQMSIMRSPRCSVYVNGAPALDCDLPCPPLPFGRASFGSGLHGSLAHISLYGERLPHAHVAALYSRGPNSPTLHHALSLPTTSPVHHAEASRARTGHRGGGGGGLVAYCQRYTEKIWMHDRCALCPSSTLTALTLPR